ncbi:hypothetical protein [Candidatus Similichlamydia laticola]|uniref:hypothetical protein n=1 Tax=Candidatus Similichlamydia laticola TaxID=2170265 RepID=UPI000DF79F13|nr:hypothetical protein [Candidatus Similichlamydia laticola]
MFKKCRICSTVWLIGLLHALPTLGGGNASRWMKGEAEKDLIAMPNKRDIVILDWQNSSGRKNLAFGPEKDRSNWSIRDSFASQRTRPFFNESKQLLQERQMAWSLLQGMPFYYGKIDQNLLALREPASIGPDKPGLLSPESLLLSEGMSLAQSVPDSAARIEEIIKGNKAPIIAGEEILYVPLDSEEEHQLKKELALKDLTKPFLIFYYAQEFTALADSLENYLERSTLVPYVRVLNSGSKALLQDVFQKRFVGFRLPILVFVSGGWALGPQGPNKQHLRFDAKNVGNGEFLVSVFTNGDLSKYVLGMLRLKEQELRTKLLLDQ